MKPSSDEEGKTPAAVSDKNTHYHVEAGTQSPYRDNVTPFAGRLGGNQSFVASRVDPQNQKLLEEEPDAAPFIPLRKLIDLRPFANPRLWKAAVIEGVGTRYQLLSFWQNAYE
jgi:hypothetical protein